VSTLILAQENFERTLWYPTILGILVVVAGIALAVHAALRGVVARAVSRRKGFLQRLLPSIQGPVRLALIILAVSAVLDATPFGESTVATIRHLLLVTFIVLVGWVALAIVNVTSVAYLRRYQMDVEDNLLARKHFTQVRILRRAAMILVGILTVSAALMTFDDVRHYGVSLLASAGAAALILGIAMQPMLSNLIAGVQIAITQPIRLDDAVVVENEWGWIEEITATYVVVRLWDWRRLVLPLSYFIERPFQNWTRERASIIGSVFLHVDYTAPVPALRQKLEELVAQSERWDGNVANLQVVEAEERTMRIRMLVSARNSPTAWDLRCEVREKMIAFLQENYRECLPRQRAEIKPLAGPSPSFAQN
jgi:small-conductance mechanosensitive channel